MFNLVVKVTRSGAVVFWIAAALSVATIVPPPYATSTLWIAGVVLVIHFFQYVFVKARIGRPDGGEISFIKTMLFGFSYWLPILINPKQKL